MRFLFCVVAVVGSGCAGHQLVGQVTAMPSKGLLVQQVNVFDGEHGIGARDVRIKDGVVAEVAEAGTLIATEGEERIDGTGRTLLPGLIDMHAHFETHGEPLWAVGFPNGPDIANAYVWAGVTTALVMQAAADQFRIARKIREGELAGPHLYLTGPRLTAPDGFPINLYRGLLGPLAFLATGAMHTATTADEARADVDRTADEFAPEFDKITSDAFPPGTPKLTTEAMTAAIKRSRELKIRPTAHIGDPADVMLAAEAGLELFAHPPTGGVLGPEQLARLAELKIPFVSTQRFLTAPDEIAEDRGSVLERELLTPKLLASFNEKPADFKYPAVPEGFDVASALKHYRENLRTNLKHLHEAGVPVFAGTDAGSPGVVPGAAIHRELRAMVEAGLSNEEVLRAATSAPADFLDPAKKSFGRVAVGQRADLVIVEGDPLTNISATENVREVFVDGARLQRVRRE
ncbi:MAG: amidohydrolase family protein [Myxococcaceae bacterium]|nr:amidohydrolase family protein [Myxococcaceae bacterium]